MVTEMLYTKLLEDSLSLIVNHCMTFFQFKDILENDILYCRKISKGISVYTKNEI